VVSESATSLLASQLADTLDLAAAVAEQVRLSIHISYLADALEVVVAAH